MTAAKTSRLDQARAAVAYHEAGHAVVALQLGYDVGKVTIVPRYSALGTTEVRRSPFPSPDDIKINFAGAIAEALVNPDENLIAFGSRADRRNARLCARDCIMLGFITRRDKDILITELLHEARALVRRNREAIIRVAAALLEHGTLSGDEVKRIMEVES